ncbi:hypothetical protein G9A89_004596 [Geosiphon pyriformis]|nr:hypothetical protein G9A89_004596 [Geosiphon pyriformis]
MGDNNLNLSDDRNIGIVNSESDTVNNEYILSLNTNPSPDKVSITIPSSETEVIENSETIDNDNGIEKKNLQSSRPSYSRNILVGGQTVHVVDCEENVFSGEGSSTCCVLGSPKHVAALKAKVDELKEKSERIERERAEAIERSQSVSNQLDKLVGELKELGHNGSDNGSEQTIHATVHTFGTLKKLEIIADEKEENGLSYERLIRPPRVRQYWHKGVLHRELEERRTSMTELFWDLIFVAVAGVLGHSLVSEDINGARLEAFFITFFPIWRLWVDVQLYLNVYSSDDLIQKFLVLWEIIIVVCMASHSHDITGEIGRFFIASFVVGRLTMVALFLGLAIFIPMFRISFITAAWGIFIPSILWIVVMGVHDTNDKKKLIWSSIAFDLFWQVFVPIYNRYGTKTPVNHTHTRDFERADTLTDPVTGAKSGGTLEPISRAATMPHRMMKTKGTEYQWKWRDLFSLFKISEYRPALNIEHWSERLGTYIIISIGEMVVAILYTSYNSKFDWELGKALLGLLIAYNLHWIYFDVDASRQYQHALRRHVISGVLFGLIHLPLAMSLIIAGDSLALLVKARDFTSAYHIPMPPEDHLISYGSDVKLHNLLEKRVSSSPLELKDSVFWLFGGGLAVTMFCMGIIAILHKGLDAVDTLRVSKVKRIIVRLSVSLIYALLPLANLNSLDFLLTIAILSLFVVCLETYGRLRKKDPLFGHCDSDIICRNEEETERRYVRWRWGSGTLGERSWTRGILRKKKNRQGDGNEKGDENGEEENRIGDENHLEDLKFEDPSQHY